MEMRLSPVPDVDDVMGEAPWHDKNRIDANVVAFAGVARGQQLGGNGDAAKAIFIERPRRCFRGGALLDLDKGEGAAAPGNQIHLAARHACTAGEDAPALEPQPPGGNRLRPAAARFRLAAVQSSPPNSSARA